MKVTIVRTKDSAIFKYHGYMIMYRIIQLVSTTKLVRLTIDPVFLSVRNIITNNGSTVQS